MASNPFILTSPPITASNHIQRTRRTASVTYSYTSTLGRSNDSAEEPQPKSLPSLSITASKNNQATGGTVSETHTSTMDHTNDVMVLHDKNLKEVRRLLATTMIKSPIECLAIINTLQHLAIDYHFQEEIEFILSNHYRSLVYDGSVLTGLNPDYSLFSVSLCFRLLRQNGYHVTTDVFNIFLDKQGEFEKQHSNDINGMMSLYQASQFGTGEKLLDQAHLFTSKKLYDSLPQLNQNKAHLFKDSLQHPYHKTLARFNVKKYIKHHYVEQGTYGVLLRELGKMDFNIVQSLHQRELKETSAWWGELGLTKSLTFVRDQPVKWYMWSMAILADPLLSDQRIDLTKPISLIYVLDDIFDVYGTLHQLELLTDAINKWEIGANDQLPYPMSIFLKTLDDITTEISNKILKKYGWNPIQSLRRAWKDLCNAFLAEAKWFSSGKLPSSVEYLKNGTISSGVHVLFIHLFFILGDGINKKNVELVENIPCIISYPATILRLWDDLGSAKDENQEGYDGSYMDCYMKENKNLTLGSAKQHVIDMISDTWKKLNKEYISEDQFSLTFKKASLNLTRMVHIMYTYDSNQRLPILERHIKSMLYETIPVHNN